MSLSLCANMSGFWSDSHICNQLPIIKPSVSSSICDMMDFFIDRFKHMLALAYLWQ